MSTHHGWTRFGVAPSFLAIALLVACSGGQTPAGQDGAGGCPDGGSGPDCSSPSVDAAGGGADGDASLAEDGTSACPEGFSGADCSFCSLNSAGEACHPMVPADLYDLDAIKALSLDDLGWTPTRTWTENGVTFVEGDFTTPFAAVDSAGAEVDVMMTSKARIHRPEGWPAVARAGSEQRAIVFPSHYESGVESTAAEMIARVVQIPVLTHGEYRENWLQLGFSSKKELNQASAGHGYARNPCEPTDLVRGQYRYFLAHVDMRATTLLQRLAEAEGGELTGFGLRGFSKEGGGVWLASMVDDRIEVSSPGGFPAEDLVAYAENVIAAHGAEGAGAALSAWWYRETPAGAAFLHGFDVARNVGELRPRLFLIDGDVHLPGMHDGNNFDLGPEVVFLDRLDKPWRYVRKAEFHPGATADEGDSVSTTVVPYLLAELLVRGADSEDDFYPKVRAAEATIDGHLLRVTATASAATEVASAWVSWSDDRVWNEEGQAPWVEVALVRQGATTWAGEADLAAVGAQDKVIGWYVEARNTLTAGAVEFARKDATPIRFLQETEALTWDADAPACGPE